MPLMDSYRSVIFDLDGTLIDSLPGITVAVQHALRGQNVLITPNQLRRLIGPPIREILRKIAVSASEEQIRVAEREFRAVYDSTGWRSMSLFSSTRETLERLRHRAIKLFLFTNKPEKVVNRIVREFELDYFFVDRYCKDSREPPFESKGDMLRELMAKHNLSTTDALVVGDGQEDLHAAQELGIPFVLATYGYGDLGLRVRSLAAREIDSLGALLVL